MPVTRRKIDPATGDYIVVNGRPVEDPTHASEVLIRLRMKYGSAAVDPKIGSRIRDKIKKLTSDSPRNVELYAVEALAPMVARKAIKDVEAACTVDGPRGAVQITVSFVDSLKPGETSFVTHRVG